MAMVILGAAAAGVLLPFVSAARVQTEAACQVLAAKLASDLLEQMLSTPFDQIETRWNGYTEAEGQVKNASGEVFFDRFYSRFSRQAVCQRAALEGVEGVQLLWLTVNVSYGGREMIRLQSLAGPY